MDKVTINYANRYRDPMNLDYMEHNVIYQNDGSTVLALCAGYPNVWRLMLGVSANDFYALEFDRSHGRDYITSVLRAEIYHYNHEWRSKPQYTTMPGWPQVLRCYTWVNLDTPDDTCIYGVICDIKDAPFGIMPEVAFRAQLIKVDKGEPKA